MWNLDNTFFGTLKSVKKVIKAIILQPDSQGASNAECNVY